MSTDAKRAAKKHWAEWSYGMRNLDASDKALVEDCFLAGHASRDAEVETLRAAADRLLQVCALDGKDGTDKYRIAMNALRRAIWPIARARPKREGEGE